MVRVTETKLSVEWPTPMCEKHGKQTLIEPIWSVEWLWALTFGIVCATNTNLGCGSPWLLSGNSGAVLGNSMCYVGEFLGHSGEFRNAFGEFRFFGACNCVLKMGVGGAIIPFEKRFYNTKRWKGWCEVAGRRCWPTLCTLSRILPNPAVYFMWQPPFPSSGRGVPKTLSLGSPTRSLRSGVGCEGGCPTIDFNHLFTSMNVSCNAFEQSMKH